MLKKIFLGAILVQKYPLSIFLQPPTNPSRTLTVASLYRVEGKQTSRISSSAHQARVRISSCSARRCATAVLKNTDPRRESICKTVIGQTGLWKTTFLREKGVFYQFLCFSLGRVLPEKNERLAQASLPQSQMSKAELLLLMK